MQATTNLNVGLQLHQKILDFCDSYASALSAALGVIHK